MVILIKVIKKLGIFSQMFLEVVLFNWKQETIRSLSKLLFPLVIGNFYENSLFTFKVLVEWNLAEKKTNSLLDVSHDKTVNVGYTH